MHKVCLLASFFFLGFVAWAQSFVRHLPELQAELGVNYAYAFSNNWAVERSPDQSIRYFRDQRNNFGVSVFGRVMTSTALNFFGFREDKRFRWGDVFVAETRLGFRRRQIEKSNHLLMGYLFSVGLTANYLLNPENEIGLILVPLKFASDRVSPNVSGSYVAIRYGNRQFAATFRYESRDLSFAGWLVAPTLNPRQYTLEVLFKKKYGCRIEWAANRYSDRLYGGRYQNSFPSISVFWGAYVL